MQAFGASDQGRVRRQNQDRFLVKEFPDGSMLLAVADGLGGQAGGDVAAQAVVDALARLEPDGGSSECLLALAVETAEHVIREKTLIDPRLEGMGSTATVAWVQDGFAVYAHLGDSRLYLWRKDILSQITTDHTFLQDFLDDGSITPEQAKTHPFRNILEKCVGCAGSEPDTGSIVLHEGDTLILCTDGLFKELQEADIATVMASNGTTQQMATTLLNQALAAGGRDNTTVIVMQSTPTSSNS
ncbi:protein serine/threonine phosphatase (plasmid) [Solidesulfovibrio carbinoliphilus subsp. oakridgensis]|jgi:protein phosphatase|uniref:Protein serine/threonine phosphatase n=1 Tax=Solidesulfovibrio carbinoliphilus subsp. oakridgensis TaxID=694327 RepID=G7QEC7_9BACT|nr:MULTISPECIES: protein phosphatase 2C domain-containing protein [Desulfovibrionaceae]EHJ45923.1 protein serine/threonine phosphatase [Solidesulfovibrio carbinoliphilus subsp. oakridgensis]KHK00273.1 Protein serine/threonine phosphatase PrpC, regulation of stationary phase [Desulfovibrio sp. TomC]